MSMDGLSGLMRDGKASASLPKLWSDSCLRPYLGEINRRHGIIETLAMPSMHDLPPSRIETLFVSPLLAESSVNAESDPETWPSGLGLFQALEVHPRLVVLGDPGGGKTTLSNWLAWRLSAGLTVPLPEVLTDRIPLPCVLRDMSSDLFADAPTVSDLAVKIALHLLGDKADAALMDSLQARVAAGQYVLILDGVDEVAVSHRKVIADWMRQAHEQNACVLATSRIVGYEDWVIDQPMKELRKISSDDLHEQVRLTLDVEIARLIEGNKDAFTQYWAVRRYLLPFDPQRIAAFAENWYRQRCGTEQEARQKTNDLLTAIAQSDTTRQLARTPNLLSMMAIVHRERAHLPDGKALLYEEIANAYINTIDQQRKILPNDALAPYAWKARKSWLAYIAFQMQRLRSNNEKDAGVLVTEQEVLDWLSAAMRLSGVAQPEATAQEYLRWVARRSGLLLPRGASRYAFVHLSFQEYFCACHLATRIVSPSFIKDKLKEDEPVTKAALADWAKSTVWRETLVNLFELISAEQDVDWIEDLTEILFGGIEEEVEFAVFDGRAELAARLILDSHIRLSAEWEDILAYRCRNLTLRWSRGVVWDVIVAHGYAAELSDTLNPSEKLRTVCAFNSTFSDLTPLTQCRALRNLELINMTVSDLSPLVELSALRSLNLSGTAVSDLRPLARLENLISLQLDGTAVSDLTPLTKLINLQYLTLSSTAASDLTPLARLSHLFMLDLRETPVLDVSPLAELTNLHILVLDHTYVTDVSALAHLTQLKIVGLPEQSSKT
ncbi:MAG: NACHT domain-containing protein [Gallionella sp.]|nr:NACHT domain-containing protein [Gallionella sp.]MDD4958791.1 NACHT domain-containing protein [Gallionella sp.]